jgi:hypothetical protein
LELSEKMVRASVGKMEKKQLLFVVVRAKWKNGKKLVHNVGNRTHALTTPWEKRLELVSSWAE